MGRLEVRVHGTHHRERTGEVDVDRAPPLGVVDLVELLRGNDAGAVDEDVDARHLLEGLVDGLAGLGGIGDVELVEVVALAAELLEGLLALLLVTGQQDDMTAALNDALGNLKADALSAAGDDGGLSGEVESHTLSPFLGPTQAGHPKPARAFRCTQ